MFGKLIGISLFFVLANGQCSGCLNTSQYCDSSSSCIDVVYNYFVDDAAPTTAISEPYAEFHVGMISDIQFYYINCKEQESLCIMDSPGNIKKKKTRLDEAANRTSVCVNTLHGLDPFSLIIDGGDLTNTATNGQKNTYDDFLATLPNIPTALVLGNHDYEPGFADDVGIGRMVSYLEGKLLTFNSNSRLSLLSADFGVKEVDVPNGVRTKYVTGSFMYSIEVEGIVFIMMHWAPALKGGFYENEVYIPSINGTESGYDEYYNITDGSPWISTQLTAAKNAGKKVVLVPHFVKAMGKYFLQVPGAAGLRTLVEDSVIAVLTGHDHDQWGYYGEYSVYNTTEPIWKDDLSTPPVGIPIYYGGSATYQKLLSVKFQHNGTSNAVIKDQAYTTEEGNLLCTGVARDNSD